MTNIRLMAVALMLAGTTAACSDALDRNLTILEGKQPEEPQEPSREAAKPVNEPEDVNTDPPVNAEPPFECVSIFRIQTCEAGVLYMLDDQMNWILPGRTE